MVSIIRHQCRPVTLKNIHMARNHISSILQRSCVPNSISHKIQLCFSEAATNLAKHASPAPNCIFINLEYQNADWTLHLDDDGQTWDPTLPSQIQSLDIFEQEKQGGRGLALMQSLTDDIHYSAKNELKSNRLTLRWHNKKTITKPRVLIVDDDECQRRLYTAYLSEHYTLLEADSGESALKLLQQQHIDLVISDIRMPGMDGLTLKKALHQDDDALLTPFIFLTFADNPDIRDNALCLGIDDYILKPVAKAALHQSVQRVLKRTEQIYQQLTQRVNKRITNTLTPSLPKTAYGWEMAVASRNTGVGGGDVVLYRDDESRLIFNVVDIMGHDIAAKFFSYAYGGYLRGLLCHLDGKPHPCSALLAQLSDSALQDELLSQIILSCCSTMLAPNGQLEIACAGHPAPYLISPTAIRKIEVGGMLPGVLLGAKYQSMTMRLARDERVAIYTDGLLEAAADEASRQRLEHQIILSLHATLNLPLAEASQQVMQTFEKYGCKNRDDATLILIQREKQFYS